MSSSKLNFMFLHGLLFFFVYSDSVPSFIVSSPKEKLGKDVEEDPLGYHIGKINSSNSSRSTRESFKMPMNSPEVSAESPQEVMFHENKSKFEHNNVPRGLFSFVRTPFFEPFKEEMENKKNTNNGKEVKPIVHSFSNRIFSAPPDKLTHESPEPRITDDVNRKLFLFNNQRGGQSSESHSEEDFGRKIFLFRL